MNDIVTLIGTVVACPFGSGGIVLWCLNRIAKKIDGRDKVIFKALRNHEINGDSEEQERKMDEYFLSLLMERGET